MHAAYGPELHLYPRQFAGAATAVREAKEPVAARHGYPAAYVGLGVLALPSETCQAHAHSKARCGGVAAPASVLPYRFAGSIAAGPAGLARCVAAATGGSALFDRGHPRVKMGVTAPCECRCKSNIKLSIMDSSARRSIGGWRVEIRVPCVRNHLVF